MSSPELLNEEKIKPNFSAAPLNIDQIINFSHFWAGRGGGGGWGSCNKAKKKKNPHNFLPGFTLSDQLSVKMCVETGTGRLIRLK